MENKSVVFANARQLWHITYPWVLKNCNSMFSSEVGSFCQLRICLVHLVKYSLFKYSFG